MNVEKARRSRITIAGIEVEVFQLPGGEYVMSQTQAAGVVERQASSIFTWLQSEQPKALLGETPAIFTAPIQDGIRPIQAIPIDVVIAYWQCQAMSGNFRAGGLTFACMKETLERRCDAAFGVSRSEKEREGRAVAAKEVWEITRNFTTAI